MACGPLEELLEKDKSGLNKITKHEKIVEKIKKLPKTTIRQDIYFTEEPKPSLEVKKSISKKEAISKFYAQKEQITEQQQQKRQITIKQEKYNNIQDKKKYNPDKQINKLQKENTLLVGLIWRNKKENN